MKSRNKNTVQMPGLCNIQTKCTETNVNDNRQQDFDLRSIQSPVFNIHIHVPAYQGDGLTMYLPKIQPVINLHFDELARKLEINGQAKNKEATFRTFQNLLSMTAPKYGNLKIHYKKKSNATISGEPEISKMKPRSSQYYNNDTVGSPGADSERVKSRISGSVTESFKCNTSITAGSEVPEKVTNESKTKSEETLRRKFKLKEAVILLKDIRKTKYYKYMVAAGYINDVPEGNEDDELSKMQEERFSRTEECTRCCDKREDEYQSAESRPQGNRNVENVYVNPISTYPLLRELLTTCDKTSKTINEEPTTNTMSSEEKDVTVLSENCNFSDIVSRFRLKRNDTSAEDSAKCIENTAESDMNYASENKQECSYEPNKRLHEETFSHEGLVTKRMNLGKRIDETALFSIKIEPNDYEENDIMNDMIVHSQSPNMCCKVSPENTAIQSPFNNFNDSISFSENGSTSVKRE